MKKAVWIIGIIIVILIIAGIFMFKSGKETTTSTSQGNTPSAGPALDQQTQQAIDGSVIDATTNDVDLGSVIE